MFAPDIMDTCASLVHDVKDTDFQPCSWCQRHRCPDTEWLCSQLYFCDFHVSFCQTRAQINRKTAASLLLSKKKKFLFHSYQEGLWMWHFFTWDPLYEVWSQTFSLRGTSTSKVFEVHSVQHHTQHDLVSHSIRILTKIHISTVWQ